MVGGVRILIVSDFLDPENPGGASRYLRESARALARRGRAVSVVSGLERPRPPEIREGVHYRWFPYDPYRGGAWAHWSALRKPLRAAIRDENADGSFDAVMFHQPASARSALGTDQIRRLPAGYLCHSPWPLEHAAAGGGRFGVMIRRHVERTVLEKMPVILTLSRYMAGETARVHDLTPDRFRVVGAGVDPDRFRPTGDRAGVRRALEVPDGCPLWLTVRRLVPRMGIDLLLEAAAIRRRTGTDFRLVVAGTGPLRAALEAQTASLGLGDRVRFAGLVPEGDLPGLYSAADAFVLPTRELEGFGLVLVEALACGVPGIGTPVGAIPEILGKVEPAWIAAAASPEALADRLAALPFPVPEGLRQKCRGTVMREFTWDAVAERIEAGYQQILNGTNNNQLSTTNKHPTSNNQ